eukprot:scaffold82014_cov20-Tisochrysis_lutea.AAC.2
MLHRSDAVCRAGQGSDDKARQPPTHSACGMVCGAPRDCCSSTQTACIIVVVAPRELRSSCGQQELGRPPQQAQGSSSPSIRAGHKKAHRPGGSSTSTAVSREFKVGTPRTCHDAMPPSFLHKPDMPQYNVWSIPCI